MALIPYVKGQTGNPYGRPPGRNSHKLLSKAYKAVLGNVIDDQTKEEFNMPDGSTWADLIAKHMVSRAIGRVPDEKICFRAVTELRETTEGKTPEKVLAAGTNEELANLAKIMQGEPASTEDEQDENTAEDQETEQSEENFHSDDSHKEE